MLALSQASSSVPKIVTRPRGRDRRCVQIAAGSGSRLNRTWALAPRCDLGSRRFASTSSERNGPDQAADEDAEREHRAEPDLAVANHQQELPRRGCAKLESTRDIADDDGQREQG